MGLCMLFNSYLFIIFFSHLNTALASGCLPHPPPLGDYYTDPLSLPHQPHGPSKGPKGPRETQTGNKLRQNLKYSTQER